MENKVFNSLDNGINKGFYMTFQNGFTISIQFSKRNYCDEGITTAEVAAWKNYGEWIYWNGDNWVILTNGETEVMSHQTPDDVAKMISELVKLK